MRKATLALLALATWVSGAVLAQEAPAVKIGVFDAARVSEETAEGKRVQAKLSAFRDKKQAEVAAKEKEVADLQGQLTSQALSLSVEKRSALEKDVQRKLLEVNQAREAAQREMQMELAEAQNGFNEQLVMAVESLGRDEGFTLILERSVAVFASPAVDVTTSLVDRFNRMFPSKAEPAAKPEDKPAAPPPSGKK